MEKEKNLLPSKFTKDSSSKQKKKKKKYKLLFRTSPTSTSDPPTTYPHFFPQKFNLEKNTTP